MAKKSFTLNACQMMIAEWMFSGTTNLDDIISEQLYYQQEMEVKGFTKEEITVAYSQFLNAVDTSGE